MEKKKSVLISLRPQFVFPIFEGRKIYEVRKRAPLIKPPFDVFVYCTKRDPKIKYESMLFKGNLNGLVCGKFTCSEILKIDSPFHGKETGTLLSARELAEYAALESLYYIKVSNPILFMMPLELSSIGVGDVPPQSWRYLEN